MVDQLVELEHVDLVAVQSRKPVANVLEQREQLAKGERTPSPVLARRFSARPRP